MRTAGSSIGTFRSIVLGFVLALVADAAPAGVMTFDTLAGPDGAPFFSLSEDGVALGIASGNWYQLLSGGAPAPSIYTTVTPFNTTLSVTAALGGVFDFQSFDVGSPLGQTDAGGTYLVTEYLQGAPVFVFGGSTANGAFTTVADSFDGLVDHVAILLNFGSYGGVAVDNVRTSVPEPPTLVLLGAGVAALLGSRKRAAARIVIHG